MAKLPKGVIPIKNPKEVVGDRYYYPSRNIRYITIDHRRYHLVLWRNTQLQAGEVGFSMKQAHDGLRYATRGITFYEAPVYPQTHKSVDRWGLYVRME